MEQRIKIDDRWYVEATAARTDERTQVLKNDETFAVFDRFGDLQAHGDGEQGLYDDDTRYLSHLELLIDGLRPLYLGATVKENDSLLVIQLMNPDLKRDGSITVTKGSVHVLRAKLLWEGACYEHLRFTNHGLDPIEFTVSSAFDADYVDVFEVRGMKRERRGQRLPPAVTPDEVRLGYVGLDGVARRTILSFDPVPVSLSEARASYRISLAPGEERHVYTTVSCRHADVAAPSRVRYEEALRRHKLARSQATHDRCVVETSNPLVNLWLDRSASDLAMLTTKLPSGPYPYAGVPWYSTTFGRDGILTARECLWVDPSLARGVLAFLAQTQATTSDPHTDSEPGKILHEARRSEMARVGEIPFAQYYGSVDSTPLFISLVDAYHTRTGDLEFVRELWPNVRRALEWIDQSGDLDHDGFVEYARRSADGLVQQGWKDSNDSVFHADGRLADAPIALCEVQGYVYEAKCAAARLARHMGDPSLAERLEREADALRKRFDEAFWCERLGTYAIALDGEKRQCEVASSNAGHTLLTGIAYPERAQRVVDSLMSDDFFTGWGVRTIPTGVPRYNPMSYHNGSVWPHDNALIAIGMARYGRTDEAMRIFSALFDASVYFDAHRLPELFCGFARRASEAPTLYPVACSPQSWAAAAAFGMLAACLGIEFDPSGPEVALRSPRLPAFLDWVRVERLAIQNDGVDLTFQRYEKNVGVEMRNRTGSLEVNLRV